MKTIQLLLLCLLAFIGFGTSSAQGQQAEPRFAAGQTFVLRIAGVPQVDANQVTGQYSVSSGGTVRLPYLTEVSAIGLTPTELQRKLEAAYKSSDIYTHPTISISTNANNAGSDMVITVGGEVRQPADVPFRAGINLYAAITRCGGPTEYGDMKRVKLMRGKTERIIDLRKVGNDNNPELQAGDQVIVPGS